MVGGTVLWGSIRSFAPRDHRLGRGAQRHAQPAGGIRAAPWLTAAPLLFGLEDFA